MLWCGRSPEATVILNLERTMKCILILVVAFMLAACGSTGVVPKGDGTYTISKEISKTFSGSPDSVREDLYQEAANLCGGEQKAVETLKLEVTPASGFTKPGNVFLEFRCK
jgi:hypothetical protein